MAEDKDGADSGLSEMALLQIARIVKTGGSSCNTP